MLQIGFKARLILSTPGAWYTRSPASTNLNWKRLKCPRGLDTNLCASGKIAYRFEKPLAAYFCPVLPGSFGKAYDTTLVSKWLLRVLKHEVRENHAF